MTTTATKKQTAQAVDATAKFSPTLSMLAMSAVAGFSETVGGLVSAHPAAALAIATILTAIANFITPPKVATDLVK